MGVCRVCLYNTSACQGLNVSREGIQLGQMLKICVPEMYLGLSKLPVLCNPCTQNLVVTYKFRKTCMKTEEHISNYLKILRTTHSQIELEDVVNFVNRRQKTTETSENVNATIIPNSSSPFSFRIENVVSLQEPTVSKVNEVNIKKEIQDESFNENPSTAVTQPTKSGVARPVLQHVPILTALDKNHKFNNLIATNRFGLVQTASGPAFVRYNIPHIQMPSPSNVKVSAASGNQNVSQQVPVVSDHNKGVEVTHRVPSVFAQSTSSTTTTHKSIATTPAQVSTTTKPVEKKVSTNDSNENVFLGTVVVQDINTTARTGKSIAKEKKGANDGPVDTTPKSRKSMASEEKKLNKSLKPKTLPSVGATTRVSTTPSVHVSTQSVSNSETSHKQFLNTVSSNSKQEKDISEKSFQQKFADTVLSNLKQEKRKQLVSLPALTCSSSSKETNGSVTTIAPSGSSSCPVASTSSSNVGSMLMSESENKLAENIVDSFTTANIEIKEEPKDEPSLQNVLHMQELSYIKSEPEYEDVEECVQVNYSEDNLLEELLKNVPEMETEDIPEYIKIKRIVPLQPSGSSAANPLTSNQRSLSSVMIDPNTKRKSFSIDDSNLTDPLIIKPKKRIKSQSLDDSNSRKRRGLHIVQKELGNILRNGFYIYDHDYALGKFSYRDKPLTVNFRCYICDYEGNLSTVDEHMKQHVRENLSCHMCSESFETPYALNKHIMMHAVICTVCNTEVTFHVLKEHQEMHSQYYVSKTPGPGEDCSKYMKQKKYKCQQCPSYFRSGISLANHEIVHERTKKRKRRSVSVTEHQEMNSQFHLSNTPGSGEDGQKFIKHKKYKCRHCPSYFTNGMALAKHEIVHMERTKKRKLQ